jgi:hypothetical protein
VRTQIVFRRTCPYCRQIIASQQPGEPRPDGLVDVTVHGPDGLRFFAAHAECFDRSVDGGSRREIEPSA